MNAVPIETHEMTTKLEGRTIMYDVTGRRTADRLRPWRLGDGRCLVLGH